MSVLDPTITFRQNKPGFVNRKPIVLSTRNGTASNHQLRITQLYKLPHMTICYSVKIVIYGAVYEIPAVFPASDAVR
jgi:hypothetical protein